jgi:hypothetical protein
VPDFVHLTFSGILGAAEAEFFGQAFYDPGIKSARSDMAVMMISV